MPMQIRRRSHVAPPGLWRESNWKARIESSTNDQNPMPLRVHHAKTLTLRVAGPTSAPSPDPPVGGRDRIGHCRPTLMLPVGAHAAAALEEPVPPLP
jgi:hypothetical protein